MLPRPPFGTYDPAIDAAERAAKRGYGDLQADVSRGNARAASDYAIGLEDIGRQRDYGLADLLRQETRSGQDVGIEGARIEQDYRRSLADLLTARAREGQDYGVNISNLRRNYINLAGQQNEQAAVAGMDRGGALMQALQKRTENEARDRLPIDLAHERFGNDSLTAQGRLDENRNQAVAALDLARRRSGEDIGTARQRLTTEYGTGQSTYKQGTSPWVDAWMRANPGKPLPAGVGPRDYGVAGQRLSLQYQRGGEDRSTTLRRAGRELNAYGQDLVPTRFFSASGLTPYTPPRRYRRRR